LGSRLHESSLDIGLEITHVVVGRHNNSKDVLAEDKGGKLGKRLLSRTTHTDKEGVTTRLVDDSADSGDVLHSLLEKHKLHGGNVFVVIFKFTVKSTTEFFIVLDGSVRRIVTLASVNEGSEDERSTENLSLLVINELLFLSSNHGLLVLFEILIKDKSILPDTVALVSPKSNDFHGLTLEFLGGSVTHVLDNLSEISHVELVMELKSSGSEFGVLGHVYESLLSGSNDLGSQLLDVLLELSEVTSKDLTVDSVKNFFLGDRQAHGGEMSGKTDINKEGSGLGVHASNKHDVGNSLLDGEISSIIVGVIVNELSDEGNGLLGEIFINLGHVQIINKVNKSLSSGRTVKSTSSLINVRFNNNLKTHGVSVRVEINLSSEDGIGINILEVILHNGSLTSTGGTNIKDTLLGFGTDLEEQLLSGSLRSSNNKRGERAFEVRVECLDLVHPVAPYHVNRIEVVIINGSTFRELDLGARRSKVSVEFTLGFINTSSERPDHSKSEEAIVDVLDLLKRVSGFLGILL
jgi:hypothetical protein